MNGYLTVWSLRNGWWRMVYAAEQPDTGPLVQNDAIEDDAIMDDEACADTLRDAAPDTVRSF